MHLKVITNILKAILYKLTQENMSFILFVQPTTDIYQPTTDIYQPTTDI